MMSFRKKYALASGNFNARIEIKQLGQLSATTTMERGTWIFVNLALTVNRPADTSPIDTSACHTTFRGPAETSPVEISAYCTTFRRPAETSPIETSACRTTFCCSVWGLFKFGLFAYRESILLRTFFPYTVAPVSASLICFGN